MTVNNKFMMNVSAKSANESFARACISAFAAQLDPTLEEINDIKTAVRLLQTALFTRTGKKSEKFT